MAPDVGKANAVTAVANDGLMVHAAVGGIEISGSEYRTAIVERTTQHLGKLDPAM